MPNIEEKLRELANMGPGLSALFGATSDILKALRDNADDPDLPEMLSGDAVADAAVIRALGVERTIKAKWNVDICAVLDLLEFFASAFGATTDFFKSEE